MGRRRKRLRQTKAVAVGCDFAEPVGVAFAFATDPVALAAAAGVALRPRLLG
jgi:hypothetical protein